MSNLSLYMIGAALLAVAVAFGAHRLGVSTFWIVIAVLVILGVALMAGVSRTRQREDSPTDPRP
jgi:membrane protein implicated in regulation of membrane protease activity